MLIILGILIFSGVSLGLGLPQKMADFAAPFHHACQKFAPHTSELENYRAIVCGTPLSFSPFREDLRRTGLIHLMVVSGSHVAFLETALVSASRHWPLLRYATGPVLVIFVLINQLEAAVVRALITLLFRRTNEHFRLVWGDVQILCMAGVFALGFCRSRNSLLSLSLSWILSLALLKMSSPHTDKNSSLQASLWKNTRAYLLIAPGLLPFSLPHPASILCNLLFAPIMGLALFPASLLAFIVPSFASISDKLWKGMKWVLRDLSSLIPQGLERCEVPLLVVLLYIAILTISAWRRENRFEC